MTKKSELLFLLHWLKMPEFVAMVQLLYYMYNFVHTQFFRMNFIFYEATKAVLRNLKNMNNFIVSTVNFGVIFNQKNFKNNV